MLILSLIPQIMCVHVIWMYYSFFMALEIAVYPPWRNHSTKPGLSERVSVIAVDGALWLLHARMPVLKSSLMQGKGRGEGMM